MLKERYSISEKDFTSAELEIVPAGKARDVGFDRSMIASYGMEVVDCGVVLLSMHAPYELASKADIYETYRAYRAFLESGFELRQYM